MSTFTSIIIVFMGVVLLSLYSGHKTTTLIEEYCHPNEDKNFHAGQTILANSNPFDINPKEINCVFSTSIENSDGSFTRTGYITKTYKVEK